MEVVLKKPRGLFCWLRVYHLYLQAFPPSERKPFAIIFKMNRKGTGDVWCLWENGRFSGFCTTINGDEAVLLDYLAVREDVRGKGIGTHQLDDLLQVALLPQDPRDFTRFGDPVGGDVLTKPVGEMIAIE